MERIRKWVSSVGGYLALKDYCEEDVVSVKLPQSTSPKKESRNKPAIRMLQTCEVEKSVLLSQKSDEPHNDLNQDSSSEEKEIEQKPPTANDLQEEEKHFKSMINKPSNITRPIGFHNRELKHVSTRPICPAKTIIARPVVKEQKHNTYYQPNQLSSANPLVKNKVLEKVSVAADSKVVSVKVSDNPKIEAVIRKEEGDNNRDEKPANHKTAATQYIDQRKMEEVKAKNSVMASSGKPTNMLQRTHTQRMGSNALGVSATSRIVLGAIGEKYLSPRLINLQ
eukprot:TRINITY_DN935_c0_g3_i2.p1 TRINITY_DN935_c0_g3~~TRINITY_DN935_c0_g3_i2.p1  ORF type:complete len:281 (+),score=61.99 TRINITY_DN935_c0_g3_i2:462-1304(+)